MKKYTTEDEWEAICLKELKARARATSHLGKWSDKALFKMLDSHAVLRGNAPYDDEPPSKLLDMAMFFSEIRSLAGQKEKSFIQHTWPYMNDT
jgi:hypothetical protein